MRNVLFELLEEITDGCNRGNRAVSVVVGQIRRFEIGRLASALATAFLKWRAGKVIAKIYPENLRSVRSVGACGFRCAERGERLHRFEITMKEYLNR